MHKNFVHLNVHTEYSLIDSTVRCAQLAKCCQNYGMPAVAITDVVNTYAAIKHYKSCIGSGLKPIIGTHVWVCDNSDYQQAHQLILLSMNKKGFQSMCQLLSHAFLENQHQGRGYVDINRLYEQSDHLIVLSAAHGGLVGKTILSGDLSLAQRYCQTFKNHFQDRFYIELQRVGRPEDEQLVQASVELAAITDIPVVATNAVQFIHQDDSNVHEIRVCIQEGRLIDDKRRKRRFTDQQYLKNPTQMVELFSDIPQAIDNTVEIAKRCNTQFKLGETFLPNFEIAGEQTSDDQLIKQSNAGLIDVLKLESQSQIEKTYVDRLQFELGIINQMGFSSYFLIVADFITWAKKNKIPVGPGRGSGAGSLVAYALGITELDPIEHELLFERFLNPERVSLPDFDIDFCMEGRDRVIEYVMEKYGHDKVAQIITYGTMAARAVVRDVGRVMGLSYGYVDKIAKLIPFVPGMTLDVALKQEPELEKIYKSEEEVTELINTAKALEGLARNIGKHAGGVVIAPTELTDFSPLYCEQGSAQSITQFDKDDLESIGLVKFDFLGLKTLTVIDWALKSINALRLEQGLEPLVLEEFDLKDKKTFDLLKAAQTTAVFQLESRGMKDLILRLEPDSFGDLTALVALYRPGPMELSDDFVNRKHGREVVKYPRPEMEEILRSTYGVMLYQEQVMQIAQVLGGYSLGNADILRKAMGKKKPEEMAKQREVFVNGAAKNDIDKKTAESIFDLMEKFAGYGFNKAHSAAYALIAYQTAWLKANYPAHFLAASLSVDMDNTDKVVMLIAEARDMKIAVLPPDINQCEYKFIAADENTILYGLGAIKGLGRPVIEGLIEQREKSGRYSDLFNLCNRVSTHKVNRRALEALVCSGALDGFAVGRASLSASIGSAIDAANQRLSDKEAGQSDLFGISEDKQNHVFYVNVPNWNEDHKLKQEKATLGLYLSGHPAQQYRDELDKIVSSRLVDLRPRDSNQIIAGLILGIRTMFNRRGEKFAFVTLDDNTARIEVSVFADLYSECFEKLRHDRIIVIKGIASVDERNNGIQMRAESIYSLPEYRVNSANALIITTSDKKLASDGERFKHLIAHAGKGGLPIVLRYQKQGCMAQIKLGEQFSVNPENPLLYSLQEIFGENAIEINYTTLGDMRH